VIKDYLIKVGNEEEIKSFYDKFIDYEEMKSYISDSESSEGVFRLPTIVESFRLNKMIKTDINGNVMTMKGVILLSVDSKDIVVENDKGEFENKKYFPIDSVKNWLNYVGEFI